MNKKMICATSAAIMALTLGGCKKTETPVETPEPTPTAEAVVTEAPTETEAPVEVTTETALKFTIPDELADKLIVVEGPDSADDVATEETILNVSEKRSIEEAEADGETNSKGIGWLFSIKKMSVERARELIESQIPGYDLVAYDADGNLYFYAHPTDLRTYRSSGDYSDLSDWEELNSWAVDYAKNGFAAENNLTVVEKINGIEDFESIVESFGANNELASEATDEPETTQAN